MAWVHLVVWGSQGYDRDIPPEAPVVLGFDGSFNNDSTALVAVEMSAIPHVDVVALWERPITADNSWRVPILEVEEAIRQACRRWDVREVVCDPFRWRRSMEILEAEHIPISDYPNNSERMVPATQRFYEAAINHSLTHSGDERLA